MSATIANAFACIRWPTTSSEPFPRRQQSNEICAEKSHSSFFIPKIFVSLHELTLKEQRKDA
jgi:hypothetical protein